MLLLAFALTSPPHSQYKHTVYISHREKKDLKRGKEETAIKAVLADRRVGVLGSIPTTAKREWSSLLSTCTAQAFQHFLNAKREHVL
jgi:hypothetical protein